MAATLAAYLALGPPVLYGVELDSISGRIARLLYPKANITVAGFETTDRRDFYDIALLQEQDIRNDVRSGIGLESCVGQTDCAQ